MAIRINFKKSKLKVICNVNLKVVKIMKFVVIINEAKLPIIIDPLVILIASSPPISVTTAKITASKVANWARRATNVLILKKKNLLSLAMLSHK